MRNGPINDKDFPETGYVCNSGKGFCDHLSCSCFWDLKNGLNHATCEKKAWIGIKSWPWNRGCKTPISCPMIKGNKAKLERFKRLAAHVPSKVLAIKLGRE